MATYVNDLRLKEIATGDESGTWGASTNTNLELIAEAFSFGTEAITTNADTHTTTIADGSTDPGRSLFLKYTGTLDSACTITIGPNTVSKLWLIQNSTSGSQSIIIKQGSGATVTIPNGQTKAIYSDGAGSGGAMVDAFQDLSIPDLFIDDDLTVGDDLTVTGLATIGETLAVTGVLTANAGVVVDNITIDGTEIDLSSGDLTIDVAGDITLDAGGANINFSDDGTVVGHIEMAGQNLEIKSKVSDKDILLKGNDGGSEITALTLDMSAGGAATFNKGVSLGGDLTFTEDDGVEILARQSLTVTVDSDDDNTGRIFQVRSGASGSYEALAFFSEDVGAVFNEDGLAALDFRVESDNNTHMLFVDAGNDEVGIGTSDPRSPLHVQTSHTSTDVTAANTNSTLSIGNSGSGDGVYNSIKFAGNQQDMYIMSVNDSTQADRRLGFFVGSVAGDATTDERLSIKGDGNVTVTGSGNTALEINTGNNSGDNSQLKFGDSADGDVGQINYDHGTNAMQFRVNGASNSLVITSGGITTMGSSSHADDVLYLTRSDDGNILRFFKGSTDLGAINTNAGALVLKGASTSAPVQLQTHDGNEDIEVDPDGFIKFETSGSERLRIDTDGLKFHGDTAAANGLNDYEAGGWTPVLIAGTTNPTGGGALNPYGSYTKVGNRVTVTYYVGRSYTNTPAGPIYVSNLPFTIKNVNQNIAYHYVAVYNVNFGGGMTMGVPDRGATTVNLYAVNNSSSWTQINWSTHTSSPIYLSGEFSYIVD